MLLPMSPLDSMFLIGESREHPMHVGGVQVFQPPEGATARDYRLLLADALAGDRIVAPKLAKRPVRGLSTLGQWAWKEDTEIDLGYHVRRHALPEPGGDAELLQLCSHLHGALLDRTRPMWEMHLIEGMADGRFAVYVKVHHSVTDGVSAMKMLRSALSEDADERDMPAPWQLGRSTRPQPAPLETSTPAALSSIPGSAVRMARSAVGEFAGMMPSLGTTVSRAVRGQGGPMSISAPQTVFNVPISGARQFAASSWPLERLRLVAKLSRCTINDVVLAMSGGALRSYLDERGALPDSPLVSMVPVSLHDQMDTTGNGIGVLMCSLATNVADPADRLAAVASCMREGKEALRSMSPTQILAMSALGASPVGVSMLLGHNTLVRPPFNVIISNVAGPKAPMFWNGARLDALHPVSIPVNGQALNITCTSNDDALSFGITGCRRAVPNLESIPARIGHELRLLEQAVGIS
ncbi:wax ester/triacylglycerol synthase family O-acyltransferase [Rhodococcus triatomae]|uniref:Diacylglycerol O-acyltransferase n=1 Tax=Rhodococcus triatomae TaxID=300028 RepID=A0A1G8H4Q3_9NOCA|nr:wax ester/triacylglycerol synthase family O-acyltransferase [Rhodococcus triatomae]QNG20207.1 wax ester/triacylglycerol synthase family O-acyltransferase [Rhodococcus triatomae]QNG23878.1 wax ester/triacylglycerol synthase family O-acyltransferase [Rhodococcus triatomae]SDI01628.1 acyltransferase, WS/DGAT/MGAT [Rhodococcus triatomae]